MDKFMTRQEFADYLGIGKKKLTSVVKDCGIELEPRKRISPKVQDMIKEPK